MFGLAKRQKDFFDEFFEDFTSFPKLQSSSFMKTDIKELDHGYELMIEMPGFDKEDIKVSVDQGYLVVEATHQSEKETESDKNTYIKQERYYGFMKRSYYIGDINLDDVKGSFDKGILTLNIPKNTPKLPEKKYLEIK